MKKLSIVLVITAVALAAAPAALAKSTGTTRAKSFTAKGKVTAVDAESGTMTMKVWSGTRYIRHKRGKTVTFNVTGNTRIHRVVNGYYTAIALADVKAGERVTVKGFHRKKDGKRVYTARRVTTKATWAVRARAKVTAIDSDAKTLTVRIHRRYNYHLRARIGKELTFQITDDTKLRLRQNRSTADITFDEIVVDDKVTIWGYADNQDPTDRVYVARRLLVRR